MADTKTIFEERMQNNTALLKQVVPFNATADKLLLMDFTSANSLWTDEIINNEILFSQTVSNLLEKNNATYGIGGYNENRTVYKRSQVFTSSPNPFSTSGEGEFRCIHLGIDIWGKAGTEIYAPIKGTIHSFAFNNQYGDYGATIILQHQIDNFIFHTLYGHLSVKDLGGLEEGAIIQAGQAFAHFGELEENGHWPPHLHFQIIIDMKGMKGDYPGVCTLSEREKYLHNCPNPDLILKMMAVAVEN